MKEDTLLTHAISTNTVNNAARLSHNSVQGHYHSNFGVERYADCKHLRWSMSVGCLLDPKSPAARYANGILKRPILGCGMILGPRGNILCISDMHMPYQHQDALDFLWALHMAFDFQHILNVGDLLDHHRGSYHESEPDAYDAETEYKLARKYAQELEMMFPKMIISKGNHDILPERKLKTVGLPSSMLRDYNTVYGIGDGWQWVESHMFDSLGGFPVTHPMVLKPNGRWDKVIMNVKQVA